VKKFSIGKKEKRSKKERKGEACWKTDASMEILKNRIPTEACKPFGFGTVSHRPGGDG
jgi:hypothetical protein